MGAKQLREGGPVIITCGGQRSCPSMYETADGSFVIQGARVESELRMALSVPDHEDVVEVPRELVMQIVAAFANSK
jgi:hypothetical protein